MYTFGKNFRITIFGQSHSEMIGVTLDGLPAGLALDLPVIEKFMARRAPGGKAEFSTPRRETDAPQIVCGVVENRTCGAPLTALIANTDSRSGDYAEIRDKPRPAHSDYAAFVKFHGHNDIRGGGQFSGRLTAPFCFAGAVAKQILAARQIEIFAHLLSVGKITDTPIMPLAENRESLSKCAERKFPTIDPVAGQKMLAAIGEARQAGDSLGGIVEVAALNVPAGIGEPPFRGVENVLAQLFFAIPAVKGVEFGAGFAVAALRGSENNDEFFYAPCGEIRTRTNHHGGILGGISSGMPIIARTAIKPTPSIARAQRTVSLTRKQNAVLQIKGRHDPCIAPRAAPVVEAAMAIGLLDLLLENHGGDWQ